jgi:hypothetical protein
VFFLSLYHPRIGNFKYPGTEWWPDFKYELMESVQKNANAQPARLRA